MASQNQNRIRDLIERLARISASDEWSSEINPSQFSALSYLAKANRFSRAPSQVADFMASTRGTVSQTLKALARKGLVNESRSDYDKRWMTYSVTAMGREMVEKQTLMDAVIAQLDDQSRYALQSGLEALALKTLAARGNRQFGICHQCKFHQPSGSGGYCKLLRENLLAEETTQICHEFSDVD